MTTAHRAGWAVIIRLVVDDIGRRANLRHETEMPYTVPTKSELAYECCEATEYSAKASPTSLADARGAEFFAVASPTTHSST